MAQDAVVLSDGDSARAMAAALGMSEGGWETRMIAIDAIRSKLMLQNQLLVHRLIRVPTSIMQFIHCRT